jgi:hypothetical protein
MPRKDHGGGARHPQILDGRYGDFGTAKIGEETEFSSDSYYEEEKGTSDAGWREQLACTSMPVSS